MKSPRQTRGRKKCYTGKQAIDDQAQLGGRSLDEWREILGDSAMADADLRALIDDMYVVARATMELLPRWREGRTGLRDGGRSE